MKTGKSNFVLLTVISEEETYVVQASLVIAKKIQKLLRRGMDDCCYPEKVNALLDQCKKVNVFGTVNTMGEGWGWYDNEDMAELNKNEHH